MFSYLYKVYMSLDPNEDLGGNRIELYWLCNWAYHADALAC